MIRQWLEGIRLFFKNKKFFLLFFYLIWEVAYAQESVSKDLIWILELNQQSKLINLNGNCENHEYYGSKFKDKIIKIGKSYKLLSEKMILVDLPEVDSICINYFNGAHYLKFRKKNKEIIWFEGINYVMPFQYNSISLISETINPFDRCFIVSKNNKWGIINYKNEVVIPLQYEEIKVGPYYLLDKDSLITPILVYKLNNKLGVMDLQKKEIFPNVYNSIDQIYPTIYKCKKDSIETIINIKDNKKYTDISSYWYPDNERIILDFNTDRKIYNRKGEALSAEIDTLRIKASKKNFYGYDVDLKKYVLNDSLGNPLIKDSVFDAKKISTDYYIVKLSTKNGRLYGIVSSKNGELVLAPEYVSIQQFNSDSLIFKATKKDFSEYIINSKFKEIKIPGSYKYYEVKGSRLVKYSNNKPGYGVIDLHQEKVLIPFSTDETYDIVDKYIIYGGRASGAELLDSNFRKLGIRADNFFAFGKFLFANIWNKKEIGMSSKIYDKDNLVFLYDSIVKYQTCSKFVTISKSLSNNLILDKDNNEFGTVPYKIEEFSSEYGNDYLLLIQEDLKGLYSLKNKEIILHPQFNGIKIIDKNIFMVEKDDSIGIFKYKDE